MVGERSHRLSPALSGLPAHQHRTTRGETSRVPVRKVPSVEQLKVGYHPSTSFRSLLRGNLPSFASPSSLFVFSVTRALRVFHEQHLNNGRGRQSAGPSCSYERFGHASYAQAVSAPAIWATLPEPFQQYLYVVGLVRR